MIIFAFISHEDLIPHAITCNKISYDPQLTSHLLRNFYRNQTKNVKLKIKC